MKFDESLLHSILQKKGYLLGSKDTCTVKSVRFPTDLLESAVHTCLCSAFLMSNFRAIGYHSVVMLPLVGMGDTHSNLLCISLHTEAFRIWFFELDNLWDVLYPDIRILTHSALFLLLYTFLYSLHF